MNVDGFVKTNIKGSIIRLKHKPITVHLKEKTSKFEQYSFKW
jgi:hypothetical protein